MAIPGIAILFSVISLALTLKTSHTLAENSRPCDLSSIFNVTFDPAGSLKLKEGETETVNVRVPALLSNSAIFDVTPSDTRVISVQEVRMSGNGSATLPSPFSILTYRTNIYPEATDIPVLYLQNRTISCEHLLSMSSTPSSTSSSSSTLSSATSSSTQVIENSTTVLQIKIQGLRLGKCLLNITLSLDSIWDNTNNTSSASSSKSSAPASATSQIHLPESYPVIVLRDVGMLDRVFHIVIQVLLSIINFAFGCELELEIVGALLKKPLAPLIAFCSQFLFMPVLGLAITQILRMDPVFGIGLISLACAPGGGASNSWTILLGGDVNLSLTMTFLSLTLALGMMPLWMFITSRLYFDPSVVQIPYVNIVITLCMFVGPCFVGVILKKIRPKFAKPIKKVIKPLSVVFLLWILTVGTYVNLYMWRIMGEAPLTIVAGILLPWCGFAFGFGLALLSRQGRQRAIAIAIETGIQNMGVPIVLLQRSFPQPEGDLAATMVNSVAIFTPLPLFAALLILTVKKRCKDDDNIQNNDNSNLLEQGTLVINSDHDPDVAQLSDTTLITSLDGDTQNMSTTEKLQDISKDEIT